MFSRPFYTTELVEDSMIDIAGMVFEKVAKSIEDDKNEI
jgi:hypothetical protein